MLIPNYWAEASVKARRENKQITVRRFGWSEQSQEDAQNNAEARAQDALTRLVAGEKLERREPKVAYNGALGVPIREEVLSRHKDAVITRNLYGARCLNTPNVLFADIDFVVQKMPSSFYWGVFFSVIAALVIARIYFSLGFTFLFALATWFISHKLALWLWSQKVKASPSAEQSAMQRVDAFLEKHSDWHVRIYRTPAGLRLLAMHKTFGPDEPEVATVFKEIQADKIYVQMCSNQHCFRARVSPKPWRIGIDSHLKPRPGVWPINPQRLPDRIRWVAEYERKAQTYASCRFLIAKGSGKIDATAEEIRQLHDELCRANSDFPLA
ncbi:hypothetical protein [Undibacterium flavidum]|uniref:Uncharacterized protein n=1 Tax=Undibacterium flavidum TaxID=2762297 RepID=A0ABR6Y7R8_9BURK|nr:hypothetical protein [Undibacterium flavidum]MBC3872665.1 hypothetical protein [Undibacterium flavidum]